MGKEDFIQYKPREVSVRKLPKHFDHNDRKFIEQLMKENYREGFLNGMKIKALILLFTISTFGQSAIVASGSENITIGETFPIMQQLDTIIKSPSLGVPKYELPIEQPAVKKVTKKKSFIQKFIEFLQNLLTKNKKQK